MWILSQSKRDPSLLVKKTTEKLDMMRKLVNDVPKYKKAEESFKKYLSQLKAILADKQLLVSTATVAAEIAACNFIDVVVENLELVDFDSRKDLSKIFIVTLQHKIGPISCVCSYLLAHPHLVSKIIELQNHPDTINAASSMFKAMIEYQDIVKLILNQKIYTLMFEYSGSSDFSVSSNAQMNFRNLYLNNSELFSFHIEKNENFFEEYFTAIQNLHHLAKDTFAEILVDILESRFCIKILNSFINSKENLKCFLILFEERKPVIKLKMTKILEFFVNDSKEMAVRTLLDKNKSKIVALLKNLAALMNNSTDKSELEEFISRLEDFDSKLP